MLTTANLFSQDVKYRRSSLTTVLVESDDLGKSKDLVIKSYEEKDFPDKYNMHEIKDKKFDLKEIKITTEDFINAGFLKDTLKGMKLMVAKTKGKELKYVNTEESAAVVVPSKDDEFQIKLSKYINDKQLAKQVVATWFNRKDDGTMDWETIKKRGLYSASANDLEDANTTADQSNFLLDFGLIGNTFTVFNKLEFYPNEPYAANVRDLAKIELAKTASGILLEKGLKGLDDVYERTKEGYTVKCHTYLYQLEWDDNIATQFKNTFFNDNVPDKIKAWDTTSIMKLKFVGVSKTTTLVTFKLGEKRTEEEIIALQVKRSIDKSFAKLQKENIVFRPITPVYSAGPVTARIGLKEGLEPNQKFDILEISTNNMGFNEWKIIGSASVDKGFPIWDNREGAEIAKDENGEPLPEYTIFKGGKKAEIGMHYMRAAK